MDNLFHGIGAGPRRAQTPGRLRQAGRRGRTLSLERLEPRQLLALTHLYTFNDGLPNDWIGNAHGTLFNGAAASAGQLVLANAGVTSGQTGVVQYMKLPAGLLPATGAFSIEAWYTTTNAADWSRVFDVGDQTGADGNSYVFFSPQSGFDDSRAVIHAAGLAEHIASGPTTDDGMQHMATIVVDPAAEMLRLYLDGVEAGTTSLDGAHAGSVNDALAYLGRSLFNADPGFTGAINELRIYDEARSADAVFVDATAGPTTATQSPQARQMEYLDRGMVAVRRSTTQAYVGWRLLGTDPASLAFNLYRSANGGAAVKLNASPLANTTDFVDSTANFTQTNVYFVRPVIDGVETAPSDSWTLAANAPVRQFLNVPLQIPVGGHLPGTSETVAHDYTYAANDLSVGDVDGDGQYEIILKWDPTDSKDNSQDGYTGNVYIDAYKLDGTRLWRIDLGRNIRAGAHYTQLMVYDLDGDGRAEVALKTAPGTIDGAGNPVLLGSDSASADYRNSEGYILTGPEYLTIFNGLTGAAMATLPFQAARGAVSQWGDSYGNRVDRFTSGIAYLDGVHPSLIMGRGYYGPQSAGGQSRNEVAAYDYRNGQLTLRWQFKAGYNINGNINSNYIGQGAHSLTIGDVDADGKDEIIYGAAAIDDNGLGLYSTGLGHGDALHLSDMDPTRPGLEVFMVHESPGSYDGNGGEFRDARTGELLFGIPANNDVGRGVAADIDPNSPGYEMWATTTDPNRGRSIYSSTGEQLYNTPSNMFYNFVVWWDADLTRELLDGTTISKWNSPGRSNFDLDPGTSGTQQFAPGAASNNGTKSTPGLSADILGDWREEVVWRRSDNTALEIFTTTIPATSRLVTLMHDSQYRASIAAQNSAYNQPPHPSFFLGAGMAAPPAPQMYAALPMPRIDGDFNGDLDVDAIDLALWKQHSGMSTVANYIAGDADGDRAVDGADFLAWQRNLGATPAPTASTALASPDAPLARFAAPPLEAPAIPAAVRDEALTRLAGAFVAKPLPRSASNHRPQFRPTAVALMRRGADNWDKAIAASDVFAPTARHRDADAAEPSITLTLETLGELL
jgi:rhamnogalacturonan endolyase